MNKHRKLKACIAISLIPHACSSALLAMSSTVIKSANEIFPLFSWSLFTWPNNFHDYALRIVTIEMRIASLSSRSRLLVSKGEFNISL
jgi:hypothetical protein